MAKFFSSFPVIQYNPPGANQAGSNGYIVTDITRSVKFDEAILSNSAFMTTVAVQNGVRSDQLAGTFYNNSYNDWMFWMSNQIINPWDWYLDTYQFYNYINNKYGDYTLVQEKILFYTNNWYDNRNIYTNSFIETIDPSLTKFYQPLYDPDSINIQGYVRTPIDWRKNTNHIISFEFNDVTMPSFYSNNEIVNVMWDNLGNNFVGQIQYYSNTQMNIMHVSGNYSLGTGNTQVINAAAFQVYGTESNVTLTISDINQVSSINQFDNISPLEDVYYDSVTIFDDENNKNESFRVINAVSSVYAPSIIDSISSVFK